MAQSGGRFNLGMPGASWSSLRSGSLDLTMAKEIAESGGTCLIYGMGVALLFIIRWDSAPIRDVRPLTKVEVLT